MAPIKKIKIHKKTFFTIIISVIILVSVIFFVSWVAVMGGFLKLEKISVERNIARSQEVIADKLNNLAVKLADWAVWDDTYAFIEDKNEAYIKSNLTSNALETLQIDMMFFFNSRGELVHSNNRDLNFGTKYILLPEFKDQLGVLLTHKDETSSIAGIVMLSTGPLLIASKPIVKSDGKGPIRGSIIFASYLNVVAMKRFSRIIRAEMSVEKIRDISLPPDFVLAREAFLEGEKTFVHALGAKNIAGYSFLKDISGKDVLILKVMIPREIMQFGTRTLVYFFIALIIVGFIFGTAVYVPLEREIAGRDRAEQALTRTQGILKVAMDNSPVGFTVADAPGGELRYMNDAGLLILGVDRQSDIDNVGIDQYVPRWQMMDFDGRSLKKDEVPLSRAILFGETGSREFIIRRAGRDDRSILAKAAPIQDAQGKVVAGVAVFLDITERRLAETYHEMRDEVLQILNELGDFRDAIRRVLVVLKARTGFDAVGVRLQDGDDFPYFGQEGFSKDFLLTENTLIERGADGGICRDSDGRVLLECTCGLVISGKIDPSHPLFTKGGSFWTNDSSSLLELSPDRDPRRHPRNQCIHQGYASVALVPLRMKEQIVGLLQFNDRRKGRFNLQTVELLENIAEHIAVTLTRRKAEEALRESEKRFMDILYAAKDAILLIDGEKFVDCNESTAQMLGYPTRQQFLMTHPSELSPPQQPDGENSFEKANRMMRIAFEQGFHRFEWIHRRADGTDFPVEVSLTPIVIHGKNILHCLWRDMTETKRLTEALKRSHENLEAQVKERTAELVRSFQKLQTVDEELQRASKAKSEFLANMSHELRTPLNSIIGFSEVLYDERFGPLNERQKKYTQNVAMSGRHLLSLINDVLDLSKVEAGKMVLEVSSFSVQNCIEEVLRLMESQSSAKNIKPAMEIPKGFGEIRGDPRKIKQVIYNLLSNAIKFTPDGGKVGIQCRRVDPGIEVAVWDTGVGISLENLEKAFGAFERLGNLYTQETEGTGLGLTISRKIVELHGGKIWIESGGIGKGTAVKFILPAGVAK